MFKTRFRKLGVAGFAAVAGMILVVSSVGAHHPSTQSALAPLSFTTAAAGADVDADAAADAAAVAAELQKEAAEKAAELAKQAAEQAAEANDTDTDDPAETETETETETPDNETKAAPTQTHAVEKKDSESKGDD